MKRFKFSLQSVLDTRILTEEKLKKDLGKLRAQQVEIKDRLALLLSTRQEMQDWMAAERKHSSLDRLIEQAYLERSRADELAKEKCLAEIFDFDKLIEAKRLALVAASKEKKAVEKLEEKQHKAYLLEVAREEQAFLDELARHQFLTAVEHGGLQSGIS
jgi:flagellar FliJ protein